MAVSHALIHVNVRSMPNYDFNEYLFELYRAGYIVHIGGAELWDLFAIWTKADREREAFEAGGGHHSQLRFQQSKIEARIEREVAALLSAFAQLSQLLFPDCRRPKSLQYAWCRRRGQILRDAIGISMSHPIGDRTVRNDWVHFDERLDQMMMDADDRFIGFRFIRSDDPLDWKRKRSPKYIEPDTGHLVLFGHRHDLHDLRRAVLDVWMRAGESGAEERLFDVRSMIES